jgi:hypothetical protein
MGVMVETLDKFGAAMAEAEKHRTILRKRFGLTDHQIGAMTLARRKPSGMSNYQSAVLAARLRMENRS